MNKRILIQAGQYKLIPLLSLLVLSGCQILGGANDAAKPTFTPMPPPTQIVEKASENQVDNSALQAAVGQLINTMLQSETVQQLTKNRHPTLYIEPLKNNTSDYGDTSMIKQIVAQQVKQSNSFTLVDEEKIDQLRKDLNLSNSDELASSATAIKFVNRTGAEYLLYGTLISTTNNDVSVYQMNMQLMTLSTGAIEWKGDQTFPKGTINSSSW